jgi:hypothetical protein
LTPGPASPPPWCPPGRCFALHSPKQLLIVAALSDPALQKKYPHLAISRDTLSLHEK